MPGVDADNCLTSSRLAAPSLVELSLKLLGEVPTPRAKSEGDPPKTWSASLEENWQQMPRSVHAHAEAKLFNSVCAGSRRSLGNLALVARGPFDRMEMEGNASSCVYQRIRAKIHGFVR